MRSDSHWSLAEPGAEAPADLAALGQGAAAPEEAAGQQQVHHDRLPRADREEVEPPDGQERHGEEHRHRRHREARPHRPVVAPAGSAGRSRHGLPDGEAQHGDERQHHEQVQHRGVHPWVVEARGGPVAVDAEERVEELRDRTDGGAVAEDRDVVGRDLPLGDLPAGLPQLAGQRVLALRDAVGVAGPHEEQRVGRGDGVVGDPAAGHGHDRLGPVVDRGEVEGGAGAHRVAEHRQAAAVDPGRRGSPVDRGGEVVAQVAAEGMGVRAMAAKVDVDHRVAGPGQAPSHPAHAGPVGRVAVGHHDHGRALALGERLGQVAVVLGVDRQVEGGGDAIAEAELAVGGPALLLVVELEQQEEGRRARARRP